MKSPDIRPEILIARIAEMPHSGPTVDTFRHFTDPQTYKLKIDDLGDNHTFFGVSARSEGLISKRTNLLLYVDPNGPMFGLLVFEKRGDGDEQGFPSLDYTTGWDMDPLNTHRGNYVYRFKREVTIEGSFDPISKEGLLALEIMQYFNLVNTRYFADQAITPSSRIVTSDQYDKEFAEASERFLASLV